MHIADKLKAVVAACGFALLFAATPARAEFFFDQQIGNFLLTGKYVDSLFELEIQYAGPDDSGFFGNEVELFNVHFAGPLMGYPGLWNPSANANPDGSTNFSFASQAGIVNIRAGNGFQILFAFAPENGSPVPTGIGSEALDGWLAVRVWDSAGTAYDGYIPAPLSLANSPVPAVPEPETHAMLLAGLAVLGGMAKRGTARAH